MPCSTSPRDRASHVNCTLSVSPQQIARRGDGNSHPLAQRRATVGCFTCLDLRGGCRRRDEAKLLEHQEPVEHQVERAMFAVAEAEHLDVVHADGAAGWRDVAHGAAETPSCVPVNMPSSTATSSMM